jgi:peptide-methionine (S)-S-oxide reductase
VIVLRLVFTAALLLGACRAQEPQAPARSALPEASPASTLPDAPPEGYIVATFAGGCFWCMEGPFDVIEGVVSTTSGFTGGHLANPTYDQVTTGRTGHVEAVRVVYDSTRIGYGELLEVYWRNVDPLDAGGQFCDRGSPYRPAIFVHDDSQRRLAEASKAELEASGRFDRPVVVEVLPASPFYEAEDYHQGFYRTNPERYREYRQACGRDRRLAELWGPTP